jgi:septal ring factor EnvC (AmiA/AmiB activator)
MGRKLNRKWIFLAAALLVADPASPAFAQDRESQELKDVERALEQDRSRAAALARQAEALKLEIRALRAESIAAARQAQAREAKMSGIEALLADLGRQEAAKRSQLRGRHHQLTGTLAALQRIALLPPDALLAAPGSPVDTVRSAMLLRIAVPAIESRALALRGELAEITRLHQQIALQQHALATAAQELKSERGHLGALIERKRAARTAATSEQREVQDRAKKLAAQAKDLRDLLAGLERAAIKRRETAAREEAARQVRAAAAREAQELAERQAIELAERQARERAALEATAHAKKQARDEAELAAQKLAARQARERAEAQILALRQQQAREEAERAATAREETTQLALVRPDNVRPFPDAGATLRMPARGRVVRRYGQSGGTGGTSKGIDIEARSGAQVVAPYDGQVVYAGPFRRYGQILIIEHGGRYHTLLAGLDRIDAIVGQWLLAGEPVGILGSPQDGNPELYFELRRAGQPINPLPWLATTGDKVRG